MFNEAQLAIIKRAMTALAAVEEAPAPKARKSKAATSEEE